MGPIPFLDPLARRRFRDAAVLAALAWSIASSIAAPAAAQRGSQHASDDPIPAHATSGFPETFDTETASAGSFTGGLPLLSFAGGITDALTVGASAPSLVAPPFAEGIGLVAWARYRYHASEHFRASADLIVGGIANFAPRGVGGLTGAILLNTDWLPTPEHRLTLHLAAGAIGFAYSGSGIDAQGVLAGLTYSAFPLPWLGLHLSALVLPAADVTFRSATALTEQSLSDPSELYRRTFYRAMASFRPHASWLVQVGIAGTGIDFGIPIPWLNIAFRTE
ncbi:MAG: hypothetical protein AB7S26_20950 [Sandaracinaceae bacterium]